MPPKFFVLLDVFLLSSILAFFDGGTQMHSETNVSVTAEKIVTHCLGRFLLDLPAGMPVTLRPAYYRGWKIQSWSAEESKEFHITLRNRLVELRSAKNEKNLPTLEEVIPLELPQASGSVFVYGREWVRGFSMGKPVDSSYVAIHGLVLVGDAGYEFTGNASTPEQARELSTIIGALRHRRNDEVPSESGFCFDNGFIADAGAKSSSESVLAFAGLPSSPDLAVAFSTFTTKPDRTLLDRHNASALPKQFPDMIKPIFIGRREINGIAGDEVSENFFESNGTRAHAYTWEAYGATLDPMRPNVTVELSTGHGRPGESLNSSLSDNEVQQLWTQISGSLRLRPVRAPEPVPAAQPTRPASARVEAGQPCPASGWWTCADNKDGHDVLGGVTQYFEEGVRMPQASLLAPATLMDKLKGKTPTFTLAAPTVWKLAGVQEQS